MMLLRRAQSNEALEVLDSVWSYNPYIEVKLSAVNAVAGVNHQSAGRILIRGLAGLSSIRFSREDGQDLHPRYQGVMPLEYLPHVSAHVGSTGIVQGIDAQQKARSFLELELLLGTFKVLATYRPEHSVLAGVIHMWNKDSGILLVTPGAGHAELYRNWVLPAKNPEFKVGEEEKVQAQIDKRACAALGSRSNFYQDADIKSGITVPGVRSRLVYADPARTVSGTARDWSAVLPARPS